MSTEFYDIKNMALNRFTLGMWIKTTFYGWSMGVILLIVVSSILDSFQIENVQFYIGVCMGAGVGFAQWKKLRIYFGISSKWFWTSIVGMGLPFLILDLLMSRTSEYKLPTGILLGGLTTGFLQLHVLKCYFKKPNSWVLGCFVGWLFAGLVVLTVNMTMKLKPEGVFNLLLALLNLTLILLGGVILGIITSVTIKRINKLNSDK
jgi:hypothetical protein